jgi:phage I-like protein
MVRLMDTPLPLLLTSLDAQASGPVAVLSTEFAAGAGGWQRILPAGEFSARDGRGPYIVGDRAAMEKIVAESRAYHGATDMVVDYDHQALAIMKADSGKTAKAAGWVKGLEVRDDGIWADIKWTAAAASAIGAQEYRYLSPVIPHDAKGNVRMVLNVSLTNMPAYHIEAFSAAFSKPDRNDDMDKIFAALGLAKGASEDDHLAALNALLNATTTLASALELAKDAKPADIQKAALSVIDDRKKLVEASGVSADAKVEDAVAALTALKASGNPDPSKFVPIDQVTALATELKDLRKEVSGNAADTAVGQAIKDGKLVPALRDWGIALFTADRSKFEEFVGSAPELTDRQLKPAAKPGEQTAALTAAQENAARLLGIDPKSYADTLKAEADAAA